MDWFMGEVKDSKYLEAEGFVTSGKLFEK